MQGPDPKCRAQPRHQTIEIAAALRERNGVFGQAYPGIDGDQRQVGLPRGDLFGKRLEVRRGCNRSTAREASAQMVSITGNSFASSSADANDGRRAVETMMMGPCWDIQNAFRLETAKS
jgi:hypothetical protein